MTVQSACSCSLVTVDSACQALLTGRCDAPLAGGVSRASPSCSSKRWSKRPETAANPSSTSVPHPLLVQATRQTPPGRGHRTQVVSSLERDELGGKTLTRGLKTLQAQEDLPGPR
ncbi:beta-ketoacyl synthase N-terminal-like domain-containing protein [Streptomyces sp. NPDC051909]|uniref:beta-ketoacyl synthase N-terminal-like domain-containing protein n=1 Tax=Streptomyces sp. NPDC051909 TaxID=3154944 RepID=UPI0034470C7A